MPPSTSTQNRKNCAPESRHRLPRPSAGLRVWATEPYADFDATRLQPLAGETKDKAANIVTLPMYPTMTEENVEFVANAANSAAAKNRV